MWNDIDSGGIGLLGRNKNTRERVPVQRVPESYDIIDTVSSQAHGPPTKNCTGSGCCIPKCFAEKGNRGLPGVPGYSGPKGTNFLFFMTEKLERRFYLNHSRLKHNLGNNTA